MYLMQARIYALARLLPRKNVIPQRYVQLELGSFRCQNSLGDECFDVIFVLLTLPCLPTTIFYVFRKIKMVYIKFSVHIIKEHSIHK